MMYYTCIVRGKKSEKHALKDKSWDGYKVEAVIGHTTTRALGILDRSNHINILEVLGIVHTDSQLATYNAPCDNDTAL